jgi:6-phosphogluconolactonase (cycloisomerase 2 family)
MNRFVYVATYVDPSDGGPGGIDVFLLDDKSGALSPAPSVAGLYGPSYLARHPALPLLYASGRVWSAGTGTAARCPPSRSIRGQAS